MDGSSISGWTGECSECASGCCDRHPPAPASEPESVESLLALVHDLSERLLRRQQVDHRDEWRVARAISLSLLDALESTRGS